MYGSAMHAIMKFMDVRKAHAFMARWHLPLELQYYTAERSSPTGMDGVFIPWNRIFII